MSESCIVELKSGARIQIDKSASWIKHKRRNRQIIRMQNEKGETLLNAVKIKHIYPLASKE